MNKYYVIAVGVFMVLILALIQSSDELTSDGDANVFEVRSVIAKTHISERGLVRSDDVLPVRAGSSGVIIEILENGAQVKAGDRMFKMDSSEPEEWYQAALDRITTYENDKKKIEQELSVVHLEERNKKIIKELEFSLAKLKLALEEQGLSKRSLRLMEIDLELAIMNKNEAAEKLDRQKSMFEKGLASTTDVERAERELVAKEAQLEELKIGNELKRAGATPEEIAEMKSQVSLRSFQLKRTEAHSENRIRSIRNKLQVAEKNIAVERKDLTISKPQIDGATIFAERDGLAINIGYSDWSSGGRWIPNSVGTNRYVGDVIFEIIDPRKMRVDVLVNELDRDLITEGQNVDVYVPALRNKKLSGSIKYISGIGRDRRDASLTKDEMGKTGITVYGVSIALDQASEELRPGMSVRAKIPVQSQQIMQIIPRDYVKVEADKRYVQLLTSNGDIEKKEINAESKNKDYVVVLSGLADGDKLRKW